MNCLIVLHECFLQKWPGHVRECRPEHLIDSRMFVQLRKKANSSFSGRGGAYKVQGSELVFHIKPEIVLFKPERTSNTSSLKHGRPQYE